MRYCTALHACWHMQQLQCHSLCDGFGSRDAALCKLNKRRVTKNTSCLCPLTIYKLYIEGVLMSYSLHQRTLHMQKQMICVHMG